MARALPAMQPAGVGDRADGLAGEGAGEPVGQVAAGDVLARFSLVSELPAAIAESRVQFYEHEMTRCLCRATPSPPNTRTRRSFKGIGQSRLLVEVLRENIPEVVPTIDVFRWNQTDRGMMLAVEQGLDDCQRSRLHIVSKQCQRRRQANWAPLSSVNLRQERRLGF